MSVLGRVIEGTLWILAIASAARAGISWREAMSRSPDVPDGIALAPALVADAPRDSIADAATYTGEHNPFRLNRQPGSAVPVASNGVGVPSVPVRRPTLVLKGVVGTARAWQAVLEGVPGRNAGVLVVQGDTVGGLRVRRVGRDTVVVQDSDTTWKLTVKRQ